MEDSTTPAPQIPPPPPGSEYESNISTAMDPLEELRNEVTSVVEDEHIEKATAVRVAQIFHRMETLLRYECNKRDRQVLETRNDLEMTRLQNELDRMARRQTLEAATPPPDFGRSRSVRR